MSSLNQLPPVPQELLSELELTDNDPHTLQAFIALNPLQSASAHNVHWVVVSL